MPSRTSSAIPTRLQTFPATPTSRHDGGSLNQSSVAHRTSVHPVVVTRQKMEAWIRHVFSSCSTGVHSAVVPVSSNRRISSATTSRFSVWPSSMIVREKVCMSSPITAREMMGTSNVRRKPFSIP